MWSLSGLFLFLSFRDMLRHLLICAFLLPCVVSLEQVLRCAATVNKEGCATSDVRNCRMCRYTGSSTTRDTSYLLMVLLFLFHSTLHQRVIMQSHGGPCSKHAIKKVCHELTQKKAKAASGKAWSLKKVMLGALQSQYQKLVRYRKHC